MATPRVVGKIAQEASMWPPIGYLPGKRPNFSKRQIFCFGCKLNFYWILITGAKFFNAVSIRADSNNCMF